MHISIDVDSLIDCGIDHVCAARLFRHKLGDDAVRMLHRHVGELALNKKDLDNVGLSTSNTKRFRFIYLVILSLQDGSA